MLLEPINGVTAVLVVGVVVVVLVLVQALALAISAGLAEPATKAPRMREDRRVRDGLWVREEVSMVSRSDSQVAVCRVQACRPALRSCRLAIALPLDADAVLGSRPGHYPIDRDTP